MPWQNQGGGGGPWGGGGGGPGGPWGRGPGGQRPPDLEELLRRSQDRMKSYIPGGFGSGRGIAIIAALLIVGWGLTGFYTVQPDELGVPLVFGKAQAPTSPGFHWNFPAPIGYVEKPKVAAINRLEIGGRSDSGGLEAGSTMQQESLMLTGDENIIDIHFNVQWQITDPNKYLFEIFEPEATIKNAAEAAMREVIGQTPLEHALSGAGRKELEVRTMEILQRVLDCYGTGVTITQIAAQRVDAPAQVVEAFRDVQAAAADRDRALNEAQADYNRVTQQAEGEAQQIIKEAEGYRDQKIAIATGDASRFLAVYEEFKQARSITERRIYLETMEDIMKKMRKVLVETGTGDGSASGPVPYLPLDQLLRQQTAPTPAQTPGSLGASQ